jgi:hypothetical protein
MRYIYTNNNSDLINFFLPHVRHLKFINDFLINVEKLQINTDIRTKILIEISNLLVRDYVFDNDGEFETSSMFYDDIGKSIYEDLMTVWNYQISFCGQIGGDSNKLDECDEILNKIEKTLYI